MVLEHLPCEPNGLSLQELADGLLQDRGPHARGVIRSALDRLASFFGGLAVRHGQDAFGHADVELYGLPRDTYRVICRLFGGARGPGSPTAGSPNRNIPRFEDPAK